MIQFINFLPPHEPSAAPSSLCPTLSDRPRLHKHQTSRKLLAEQTAVFRCQCGASVTVLVEMCVMKPSARQQVKLLHKPTHSLSTHRLSAAVTVQFRSEWKSRSYLCLSRSCWVSWPASGALRPAASPGSPASP